jgi:hypothetical protein
MRFQENALPLIAAFTSGATLAWMSTENDWHKKFSKYHHVHIPFLPNYNFYVHAHTSHEFQEINKDLQGVMAAITATASQSLPKL